MLSPSVKAAIDRLDKIIDGTGPFVQLELRLRQALIDGGTWPKSAYINALRRAKTFEDLQHVGRALRDDLKQGYGARPNELTHGDIFADLLEYADYLLAEGHRDAAAVIAGGALESHLRRLAAKNGVLTTDANGKPIKSATINQELAKADVYDGTTAKQVVAWQGLRNDAAHGDYGKYNAAQVGLLILGLTNFVATYPA